MECSLKAFWDFFLESEKERIMKTFFCVGFVVQMQFIRVPYNVFVIQQVYLSNLFITFTLTPSKDNRGV